MNVAVYPSRPNSDFSTPNQPSHYEAPTLRQDANAAPSSGQSTSKPIPSAMFNQTSDIRIPVGENVKKAIEAETRKSAENPEEAMERHLSFIPSGVILGARQNFEATEAALMREGPTALNRIKSKAPETLMNDAAFMQASKAVADITARAVALNAALSPTGQAGSYDMLLEVVGSVKAQLPEKKPDITETQLSESLTPEEAESLKRIKASPQAALEKDAGVTSLIRKTADLTVKAMAANAALGAYMADMTDIMKPSLPKAAPRPETPRPEFAAQQTPRPEFAAQQTPRPEFAAQQTPRPEFAGRKAPRGAGEDLDLGNLDALRELLAS